MCEYCGCQSLASIAELTAEHDEAVNLIGLAREAIAAGDVPTAAGHARRLSRLLGPHTAVEEQALFPALAREFPEHVEHLLAEHRAVEEVLAEVAEAGPGAGVPVPDPGWLERLGRALHMLREHILAEQDGAFPAALGALDPQDWDEVDAVRARVGSNLPPARGAEVS